MIITNERNENNIHIKNINREIIKLDKNIFKENQSKVFYKIQKNDHFNPVEMLILNTKINNIEELDNFMRFLFSETTLTFLLPNKRLQVETIIQNMENKSLLRKMSPNHFYEIKRTQTYVAYFC